MSRPAKETFVWISFMWHFVALWHVKKREWLQHFLCFLNYCNSGLQNVYHVVCLKSAMLNCLSVGLGSNHWAQIFSASGFPQECWQNKIHTRQQLGTEMQYKSRIPVLLIFYITAIGFDIMIDIFVFSGVWLW